MREERVGVKKERERESEREERENLRKGEKEIDRDILYYSVAT